MDRNHGRGVDLRWPALCLPAPRREHQARSRKQAAEPGWRASVRLKSRMARFRTLDDIDVNNKRVLLRVDLNVPTEGGKVTDATRIERQAPTINEIADKGGKVILLSHFGRPKGV